MATTSKHHQHDVDDEDKTKVAAPLDKNQRDARDLPGKAGASDRAPIHARGDAEGDQRPNGTDRDAHARPDASRGAGAPARADDQQRGHGDVKAPRDQQSRGGMGAVPDRKDRADEERSAGSRPPGALVRNAERDKTPSEPIGGLADKWPKTREVAADRPDAEARKLGRLSNEDSNELEQSGEDQVAADVGADTDTPRRNKAGPASDDVEDADISDADDK